MDRLCLTVSELNNRIKTLLEQEPMLSHLSVMGELSNYKIYPSGHHYFTLKDSQSSLKCVMFSSSASKLRFRPENGMRVTVSGRVSVYPRDGAYQLYCSSIIPDGVGDLQVAFEQLKAKLNEEGLFESSCKKPLPRFPGKIAIITSSAGAAVHDMIRILGHRWPMSKVVLLPVRVQGVEAPAEIAGAIAYANEFEVADIIITGRGGGSIEDLWAFNDERVARAIFASRIPVISAVGHEPDVTISDFVADMRASTPSNAAEISVPDQYEMRDTLNSYEIRVAQAMRKKLRLYREKLDACKNRPVLTNPATYLENRRIDLDRKRDRILSLQERRISLNRQRFVHLAASLDAMSPLRVLSRGYSIASKDKALVRSAKDLAEGDIIELRFADSRAQCSVMSTSEVKEK